jgi:hypothetical protein
MSSKTEPLEKFEPWEKQGVFIATKGENTLYFVIEYNCVYGDLVTAFQVNGNQLTDVKLSYDSKRFVPFCMSSGLLGERKFEKGSMLYEYLYKPFGISMEGLNTIGERVMFSDWHHLKRELRDLGFKVEAKIK